MREAMKSKELSFSDMAKLVGERWQELTPAEKEPCERKAQAMKEAYHVKLAEYKKTPEYTSYQQYLVDFRIRHKQQTDDSGQSLDDPIALQHE